MKNNRFLNPSVALGIAMTLQVLPHYAGAQTNPPPPQAYDETPFPIPAHSVFGDCNFDMQGQFIGKGAFKSLPGGRFISISTSPGLSITLTNESSHATVTLNVTGTFKTYLDPSGNYVTQANGRNLLGDPGTGLVLAIGDFNFAFDANGNLVTPLNGNGRLLPICPMLQ